VQLFCEEELHLSFAASADTENVLARKAAAIAAEEKQTRRGTPE
jgi:hypothetical protein